MRTDYEWFEELARTTWHAMPGRSFMLLVPYGTDEAATANAVGDWTKANFQLPDYCSNQLPMVVAITPDAATSSRHFVRRLLREFAKQLKGKLELDLDDEPPQVLGDLIAEVHAQGGYPIIVIQRFHSFARIADDTLLSVLSALRECEHARQITTLAISPIEYDKLRNRMMPEKPFVNSAYGDNHDRAVMTPLSRLEFEKAAVARGLKPADANRLFKAGGGPDAVYQKLIDASTAQERDPIDGCLSRLGDVIKRFFDYSFGPPSDEREKLLQRLALGCLLPDDERMISAHPFRSFLVKRTPEGKMVASSLVLSRSILDGCQEWRGYEQSIKAVASRDFDAAGEYISLLNPTAPHLRTFCGIVEMLSALNGQEDDGLLAIDWKKMGKAGKQLKDLGPAAPFLPWIETLERWATVVEREATSGGGDTWLETLTVRAAERDIQELLIFSISTYIERTQRLNKAAIIEALTTIPESIMQALAARFCKFDFRHAPAAFPDLEYGRFFWGTEAFKLPAPGSKIGLSSLLVIVPTILAGTTQLEVRLGQECEPTVIRPLHQKYVDLIRNPGSHGKVYFKGTDKADYLIGLCRKWIETMSKLAGYDGSASLPIICTMPTVQNLSELLYGGGEP